MVRQDLKRTMCVIMVSSSVVSSMVGMSESPIQRSPQGSPYQDRSLTASPVSLLIPNVPARSHSNSLQDNTHARRVAGLLLRPIDSPRGSSPDPRSRRSSSEWTREVSTPRVTMESIGKAVVEFPIDDQPSDNGCIMRGIRFFPYETSGVAQDYGTAFLLVDPRAKTCTFSKVEMRAEQVAQEFLSEEQRDALLAEFTARGQVLAEKEEARMKKEEEERMNEDND